MTAVRTIRRSRRGFLRASIFGLVSAGVLQACASPPAPAPAKPAESKPAETKPAAAATTTPAKPAESKPAESKPAESKPAQAAPASSASGGPAGTLNWGRAYKVRSRDPHKVYGLQEMVLLRHVMEPLVELDQNGKLVPVLAESWKVSDDGLTWTFNLRKNVKFHDGTPFNAEAVKLAVERVKGNAKSGFSFMFGNYQDQPTRIVDEHTIELKTKAPEPPVPYNLVVFFIPHPEAAADKDMEWEKAIGTGPFKLVEFDLDRLYKYEANPAYWRAGYPKVRTLNYRPVVEQSSLAAATRAGEFDLVEGLSPDNVTALRRDPNLDVVALPSWRLDFLIMNQAGGLPAIRDAKVRQAMAHAIDREVIAKDILQDQATPWSTYPPKGILGATDKIPANAYDLEKAKGLMRQSGFPDGFQGTIRVPPGVGTHGKEKEVAEFVAQELQKLGIKIAVETGDQLAIATDMRDGKYDIGYLSSVAVTGDPDRYFNERIVRDAYSMKYVNPEINKMIETAATTIDPARRQALYEDIQLRLWDDMPIVYLHQLTFQYVKKKNVRGFIPMPNQVLHLTEIEVGA